MKTTRKILITVVVVALVGFVNGLARADWLPDDGHKMHYPQLPDLSPTGLDVLGIWPYPSPSAPFGKVLADDWMCSQSGPVSDIHIWGSWLQDLLPHVPHDPTGAANPAAVGFKLSIHADIPAGLQPDGTVLEYSRPGQKLWDTIIEPGDPRMKVLLYEDNLIEGFYDPNQDLIVGTDTQVFQYNFFFDAATDEIFYQEEGTIYWLDVMALVPPDQQVAWGWKTSLDHWNDDAVWGDTFDLVSDPTQWNELRYPQDVSLDRVLWGQSIDLSFVITPEPATLGLLILGGLAMLRRKRST